MWAVDRSGCVCNVHVVDESFEEGSSGEEESSGEEAPVKRRVLVERRLLESPAAMVRRST